MPDRMPMNVPSGVKRCGFQRRNAGSALSSPPSPPWVRRLPPAVHATDDQGNSLVGRDTSFSIGSKQSARGAIGSFVDIRVAIPDPY